MKVKGVIWDIVINKEPSTLRNAITYKGNQMAMVYSTDDFNFSSELPVSLAPTNI